MESIGVGVTQSTLFLQQRHDVFLPLHEAWTAPRKGRKLSIGVFRMHWVEDAHSYTQAHRARTLAYKSRAAASLFSHEPPQKKTRKRPDGNCFEHWLRGVHKLTRQLFFTRSRDPLPRTLRKYSEGATTKEKPTIEMQRQTKKTLAGTECARLHE